MSQHEGLADKLVTVNLLHQQRQQQPRLQQSLCLLKAFEKQRLLTSYADIRREPKYQQAVDFMASDVFGADFSRRDSQMQKAFPSLIKLLPQPILQAVAIAVQLNINLIQYENALLAKLLLQDDLIIDDQSYTLAFNQAECASLRLLLVEQVSMVAEQLDGIVHKPFIATTLKLCRTPAKLAGLDELQDFLERGYRAFKAMGSSRRFLHTFIAREHEITQNIQQEHPQPFDLSKGCH